jgi:hypothetical protein
MQSSSGSAGPAWFWLHIIFQVGELGPCQENRGRIPDYQQYKLDYIDNPEELRIKAPGEMLITT